jgi:transposase
MRTSKRREEIERLLHRREREGLTYAQIAAIAGIQPSTMSTWAWRLRREGVTHLMRFKRRLRVGREVGEVAVPDLR